MSFRLFLLFVLYRCTNTLVLINIVVSVCVLFLLSLHHHSCGFLNVLTLNPDTCVSWIRRRLPVTRQVGRPCDSPAAAAARWPPPQTAPTAAFPPGIETAPPSPHLKFKPRFLCIILSTPIKFWLQQFILHSRHHPDFYFEAQVITQRAYFPVSSLCSLVNRGV